MQFEENSKMHVCAFCGKSFATKKKLENHTLYHEIDPISCEVCLVEFDNKRKKITRPQKECP